jgi:hypothetical protein
MHLVPSTTLFHAEYLLYLLAGSRDLLRICNALLTFVILVPSPTVCFPIQNPLSIAKSFFYLLPVVPPLLTLKQYTEIVLIGLEQSLPPRSQTAIERTKVHFRL